MEKITFSENTKHLRTIEGKTQAQIADSIGFKQTTWGNWETGFSYPKLQDLEKLSNYFGVLESDLLHTELPESDLHEVYNRFIAVQNEDLKNGITPRSNDFKSYLSRHFSVLAGTQKGHIDAKSVTKLTQNTKKKGIYDMSKSTSPDLVLNEPGATYAVNSKGSQIPSESERIARLERILGGVMDILRQELK